MTIQTLLANYHGRAVDKKYRGVQFHVFLQKAMRQVTLGLTVTPATGRSEAEIVIATPNRQIQKNVVMADIPKMSQPGAQIWGWDEQ